MSVDFLTEAQLARYGRYADEPSAIQLARYFYLDDTDRALIAKRRGDHSRLGFALQICTARFLGTFLTDPTDVPAGVIVHLARQLSIADTACLPLYRIGKTHWEHAAEIRAAYGYQTFTAQPGHFHFVRWLYARAWLGLDRPSILFDRSTAFLVARKVMLPGASVLERHIGQARDRANVRMWRLLAQATTPEHRTQLEGLLRIPDGERVSVLEQLRRSPTLQSGNGLLEGLERLAAVRALSLPQRTRTPIPANRIANVARFAMTARAQAIARMPTDRKIATLLAFVQLLAATANDDVLDVFDTFFTTLCINARQAGIKERIRTIKDLDAAALQLATIGAMVLDPTLTNADLRSAVLTIFTADEITSTLEQVADLAQPPDDTYYDELETRYRRVGRVRPTFLRTMTFDGLPAGRAIVDAYTFLQRIETQSRPTMQPAPRAVISRLWQRYVVTPLNTIDRMAYTYCVLDRLKDAIRRREVFVTHSIRFADPRLGLLEGAAWEAARPQVCRMLGRTTNGTEEVATLAERLDAMYRSTAETLPENTAVHIETRNGKDEIKRSPLEKLDEPPSLRTLRMKIKQLVPQADLPEVLLEIHRRTGFADAFTHISEAESRADDLDVSICAVLLAEACNIGLAPLVNPTIGALKRDRLAWVQQNYIRADTLTRANRCLVDAQSNITLARHWGGGEVASADGIRFVVPVRSINIGANAKLFRRGRGVTYYNVVSDQFTGLNGIVATGTLRDSLILLSLLLGQQTNLTPKEIMTDTGAYSDVMFALFWLLGFQFSPRISDVGGTRFWRVNPTADYGPLNGLARNKVNTGLIVEHWEDILRLVGSLAMGDFHIESLVRTLQRGERPTKLARALGELGRIIKTIYLLEYLSNAGYRRRVLNQLNRGEGRHSLARVTFHGQRGELRQRYREGQEDQLGALGLVVNVLVLWNTLSMDHALTQLHIEGFHAADEDLARLSPLGYEHLNFLGRYTFALPEALQRGGYRPLRAPEDSLLDTIEGA